MNEHTKSYGLLPEGMTEAVGCSEAPRELEGESKHFRQREELTFGMRVDGEAASWEGQGC